MAEQPPNPPPTSDGPRLEAQVAGFDTASKRTARQRILTTHREAQSERFGFERPAVVAAPNDRRALIVPNRVLVPSAYRRQARAILDPNAWSAPRPVRCRGSRPLDVVAVDHLGTHAAGTMVAALDALHAAGVPAGFSHVGAAGPFVKSLAPPFRPNGTVPTTRGSRRAGIGVQVAVIDTGINVDGTGWSTSWLADVAQTARNRDPLDAESDKMLDPGAGHGTFVAGVIRQMAPTVNVRVYRALDSYGVGSEEAVACAILRAADDGADIINLSLGAETYGDRRPIALDAALRAIPESVVVVAAAGNDGDARPVWPAAFPSVIAVAALDVDGARLAPWSSHGWWVDCAIRGAGILSTFVVGDEPSGDSFAGPSPWAIWSGTSFAAPQVTALIALGAQGRTVKESAKALLAAGVPIPDAGVRLDHTMVYELA